MSIFSLNGSQDPYAHLEVPPPMQQTHSLKKSSAAPAGMDPAAWRGEQTRNKIAAVAGVILALIIGAVLTLKIAAAVGFLVVRLHQMRNLVLNVPSTLPQFGLLFRVSA